MDSRPHSGPGRGRGRRGSGGRGRAPNGNQEGGRTGRGDRGNKHGPGRDGGKDEHPGRERPHTGRGHKENMKGGRGNSRGFHTRGPPNNQGAPPAEAPPQQSSPTKNATGTPKASAPRSAAPKLGGTWANLLKHTAPAVSSPRNAPAAGSGSSSDSPPAMSAPTRVHSQAPVTAPAPPPPPPPPPPAEPPEDTSTVDNISMVEQATHVVDTPTPTPIPVTPSPDYAAVVNSAGPPAHSASQDSHPKLPPGATAEGDKNGPNMGGRMAQGPTRYETTTPVPSTPGNVMPVPHVGVPGPGPAAAMAVAGMPPGPIPSAAGGSAPHLPMASAAMVAASGVPISVGPVPNIPVPSMAAIVQGPVPSQGMPVAGRGTGAMAQRPVHPAANFAQAAAVGPPRPVASVHPMYPGAARMHPQMRMVVPVQMSNPMPYGGPNMVPMGRGMQKGPPQGQHGGRGAHGRGAGMNNPAMMNENVSGPARVATSRHEHRGLAIHRPGNGGTPVHRRPQSAVEQGSSKKVSTGRGHDSNDGVDGPQRVLTPRRSASAISHRSEAGTPTADSTPKKLAIRKPLNTPSKSPDKAGSSADASESASSAAAPEPVTNASQVEPEGRKGSPNENECPDAKDNGASTTSKGKSDDAAAAACAAAAAAGVPPMASLKGNAKSKLGPEDNTLPPPPPRPQGSSAGTATAQKETVEHEGTPDPESSSKAPKSQGHAEEPPPVPVQPSQTLHTPDVAPPPKPPQATAGPEKDANVERPYRYTRVFMCAVQNIPGEPVNKFGITATREDLRTITFDGLDDKFVGTMHKLLHHDVTGIIATEDRKNELAARQSGSMRVRRNPSRHERSDGGRQQRGGGMWGDRGPEDHHTGTHGGGRGRGGGRGGMHEGRQSSGNLGDQWNRRGASGQFSSGNLGDRMGSTDWGRGKLPPPPPPGSEMIRAKNAYKLNDIRTDDPVEEGKQRQFTSLINKLTVDNFDRIVARMGEIQVTDARTLKGFVTKIFNKALTESIFCEMYSRLCKELLTLMPRFSSEPENDGKKAVTQDIRSLVLSECQYQFHLGRNARQAKDSNEEEEESKEEAGMTDQDRKVAQAKRDEENLKARRRAMGNMQFVGHLYKNAMVTEKIVHICVQELLTDPSPEEVECVCKLVTTAGPYLQNAKNNPELFGVYLGRLRDISGNREKYDSRIRFLIMDTLELANNGWQGRTKIDGPRRIEDIHKDAAMEEQKAKQRNQRPYDYQGHGGSHRKDAAPRMQMDQRVNPRTMNMSSLSSGSLTSGRPGGTRRPGGRDGGNSGWRPSGGVGSSGTTMQQAVPAAAEKDVEPTSPTQEAAPAPDTSMPQDKIRRQVRLMIGEYKSNLREDDAALCCTEMLTNGASAASVYSILLCELTCLYKDSDNFTVQRENWAKILDTPLKDVDSKSIAQQLVGLLPDLFEENVKAIGLIGSTLGKFITDGGLSPEELFQWITAVEGEGEEAMLVESNHAGDLFGTALRSSGKDVASLKGQVKVSKLFPSYTSDVQKAATQAGLAPLLSS